VTFVKFEKYMKAQGYELNPWQRIAARRFLDVMRHHQEGKSGKTFLLSHLTRFVDGDEDGPVAKMSAAHCVKVWLDLREQMRMTPLGVVDNTRDMKIEVYENILYRQLTERLVLETRRVFKVAADRDKIVNLFGYSDLEEFVLGENFKVDAHNFIGTAEIYDAYLSFCKERKKIPLSKRLFLNEIVKRFSWIKKTTKKMRRGFVIGGRHDLRN